MKEKERKPEQTTSTEEISLINVDGQVSQAKLEYTSNLGRGGCEGVVQPVILSSGDQVTLVQVKRFYRESYDDKGLNFSQNPNQKAQESFEALRSLQQKDFKVVPFFGLGLDQKGEKFVVLTDLSGGETLEVYDEKDFYRGRQVTRIVNGEEVTTSAQKAILGLKNSSEVFLEFLRTNLLEMAYDIDLGLGVCHMITRDPKTNRGEAFVVDVGEYSQGKSHYRERVDIENLLPIPEDLIRSTFLQLVKNYHPGLNAEEICSTWIKTWPRKKAFLDLLYKSLVGLSLKNWIGGWFGDADWARKRFVKNSFPDHFMKIKLLINQIGQKFEDYTGYPLYATGKEAHDKFAQGKTPEDLAYGVDFVYLAALDSVISYLMALREAIDNSQAIPQYSPVIIYDNNRFPRMNFFDSFDETKGNTCVVRVKGGGFSSAPIDVYVEFDWETAYHIETSHGLCFVPLFHPSKVKNIEVGGEAIGDFDASKVEFHSDHKPPQVGDFVYYIYGDSEILYFRQLKDDCDLNKALEIFNE